METKSPDLALSAGAAPNSIDVVQTGNGYAGDVLPAVAYRWFSQGEALLVDVRTDAERDWVGGVPGAIAIAWKQWPGMVANADFDTALQDAAQPGQKILFLCRSGVRSIAAAQRASTLGFAAYNILEGFEGNLDADGHRGTTGGWRHAGLPWRQS